MRGVQPGRQRRGGTRLGGEGGHGEVVEVGEEGDALAVQGGVVEGDLHDGVVLLRARAHAAHPVVAQPAPLALPCATTYPDCWTLQQTAAELPGSRPRSAHNGRAANASFQLSEQSCAQHRL